MTNTEHPTLLEMFRLSLIEDFTCPECLGRLDRNRDCTNRLCEFDAHYEWADLSGESEGDRNQR